MFLFSSSFNEIESEVKFRYGLKKVAQQRMSENSQKKILDEVYFINDADCVTVPTNELCRAMFRGIFRTQETVNG